MSTIYVPAKAATPELLAHAAKAGLDVHIMSDESAPAAPQPAQEASPPAPKSSTREATKENGSPLGVYAGWIDRDDGTFNSLHPVITKGARGVKGSKTLRTKLNLLPVLGECQLNDDEWGALGRVMFKNDLVSKDTRTNGKAVVRFYAPRVKADGKQSRKATQLLRDGCRIRLDCTTKRAKLVCGNGRAPKFGKGITEPLSRALDTMDLFELGV